MSEVLVIGSGAAGMMAAVKASENGCFVRILEKNEKAGKKIYITGKGRCNVTNDCDEDSFIKNTISNPRFMYSSIRAFNTGDMMAFLEENGCPVKTERGKRVFPVSDKAVDVTKAFEKRLKELNVRTEFGIEVKKIEKVSGTDGREYFSVTAKDISSGRKAVYGADSVIIATGGLSYPRTGSTGDGYDFARSFGMEVKPLFPSLAPVFVKEVPYLINDSTNLKNTGLLLKIDNKKVYEEIGELDVSGTFFAGPLALSASAYIANAYKTKGREADIKIILDLKPGLSDEQLSNRLLRDFEENRNVSIYEGLGRLLLSSLRRAVLNKAGIDPYKLIRDITKEERKRLSDTIKYLDYEVERTGSFDESIVTSGGISVKELDPKTMESKKVSGLFFAGEVIDVDCFTGGFNLQTAWSTGAAAGVAASER